MAADLATTPQSGIVAQPCGDAHPMNFGVFATPRAAAGLRINDFDETHPGPWEWDVKRLAASFAIAGRDNGFSAKERCRAILMTLVGRYRSAMQEFAVMTNLDVWHYTSTSRLHRRASCGGRSGGTKNVRPPGESTHPRQPARLRQGPREPSTGDDV